MSAVLRPLWSYVHNGDVLMQCDSGDISITSLDSEHGMEATSCAQGESGEQVIRAEAEGLERNVIHSSARDL